MKNLDKITNNEDTKELQDKLKRIAYSESEMDLGTNPQDKEQALVRRLSRQDFDYTSKIETLVKKKLNDPIWIKNTKKIIEENENKEPSGIKFNDELYKSGRDILKSYAKENYDDDDKKTA